MYTYRNAAERREDALRELAGYQATPVVSSDTPVACSVKMPKATPVVSSDDDYMDEDGYDYRLWGTEEEMQERRLNNKLIVQRKRITKETNDTIYRNNRKWMLVLAFLIALVVPVVGIPLFLWVLMS